MKTAQIACSNCHRCIPVEENGLCSYCSLWKQVTGRLPSKEEVGIKNAPPTVVYSPDFLALKGSLG